MQKRVLQKIIKRVGTQKKLAHELGLRSQHTVSFWFKNGVPPKWIPALVKLDAEYGGDTKPEDLWPALANVGNTPESRAR